MSQVQQQAQQQQEAPRAPFYLTGQMLDAVLGGLSNLPYNVAAPVIQDLQNQMRELEQQAQAEQQAAHDSAIEGEAEEVEKAE